MDANLLDVTAFLDDAHLSTDGRTLRYRGRDYDLTAGVRSLSVGRGVAACAFK